MASRPLRYKIGISYNANNRVKEINDSLNSRSDVYQLFAVNLFFAFAVEQSLHKFFALFHAKMKGSGKTEWFWFIGIPAIALLIVIWAVEWMLLFGFIYLLSNFL
jgi:T5orf172 domain